MLEVGRLGIWTRTIGNHIGAESLKGCLFASAASALMAAVQPVNGLAPLSMAFLSGAMTAGLHPALLSIGALTGMLAGGSSLFSVPLGAAVITAGRCAHLHLQHRRMKRGGALFESSGSEENAAALLAGAGALASGLALPLSGGWSAVQLLAAVLAAAAAAPFFRAFARVRPDRRRLMPEERIGLILFLLAAVSGLAFLWTPLGVSAACMGAALCAGLGPGVGACAGLASGAALLAASPELSRCAVLGFCGLLAGLSPGRNRYLSAAILSVSASAVFLLTGSAWTEPLCALAGCAGALALPDHAVSRLHGWLSGEQRTACEPDRLAQRLRAESEYRIRALSEAFGELAEGYRVPVDIPDEQTLICQMREHLCENCSAYAQCWVHGDNRAVRLLCQLISESIDWAAGDRSEPLFGDELPPDLLRLCRRGRTIPARLGGLLEEFARKRRSEMKRSAVNHLISSQFMQAQMLLSGLADAQAAPLQVRGRQASRAQAALDQAGIETSDVIALRGQRRLEIIATLKSGVWSEALARSAARSLSRTFGRIYAPSEDVGGAELKFLRLPRLRASASAESRPCREDAPSGDSHMICPLGDSRIALMLSDGMGSGSAAAQESAQTLRLLSRFLEADVSRRLALETVNELMLARTESDLFATVDLCLLDLAAGYAEFTKLAACRSLLLRRGEVIPVEGGRLPLGILENVQPSIVRMPIEAGDVILVASDGVMDAIAPQTLSDHLQNNTHQAPCLLAQSVIALAEAHQTRRDDMTAIVARISERQLSSFPAARRAG